MSRYKYPPPAGGWPELKHTSEPVEPRECNFKPIQCPGNTPCSRCEHAPENLQAPKK